MSKRGVEWGFYSKKTMLRGELLVGCCLVVGFVVGILLRRGEEKEVDRRRVGKVVIVGRGRCVCRIRFRCGEIHQESWRNS
jgi:hypothetical protein